MNTIPIITADTAAFAKLGVKRFEVADYLDSEESIAEYLNAVLDDGNSAELRLEVISPRHWVWAEVAAKSGLGRESLYKALAPGAKPRFDTVLRVIHALGIHLLAQAK